jgi:hypothetical protein
MRIIARLILVSVLALGWTSSFAQSNPRRVTVEFSGTVLKWIHAAEPEFQRRNLDVNKYMVSVVELKDSVMISLASPDAVPGARGSSGTYPGFEVEISKKDLIILRSSYIR